MESRQEALGIPSNGYEYMSLPSSKMDLESQLKEFYGINNFLLEVVNSEVIEEFRGKDKRLQFINYGNTELVYVLTVRDAKYTLLLGQPSTKFGEVRKEYENLKLLSVNNPLNIVRPIKYFKDAKN